MFSLLSLCSRDRADDGRDVFTGPESSKQLGSLQWGKVPESREELFRRQGLPFEHFAFSFQCGSAIFIGLRVILARPGSFRTLRTNRPYSVTLMAETGQRWAKRRRGRFTLVLRCLRCLLSDGRQVGGCCTYRHSSQAALTLGVVLLCLSFVAMMVGGIVTLENKSTNLTRYNGGNRYEVQRVF